ncbi:hypothetical protein N7478_006888 [Penicillium angulare]|uniref:uncharacterized protein n=1 Tax=Penicillium angulare TaxID=116970 RepID=UPI002540067E|nr:uncharacterized protein N7478_006888 [Penicillium angulare]KAJ5281516.1 hypothetical protein N7478_006888 [Penicillium angulare]
MKHVFRSRYERVSLIQAGSRQAAKPGTIKGEKTVTMSPAEFLDYNCTYTGAKKWASSQAVSAI